MLGRTCLLAVVLLGFVQAWKHSQISMNMFDLSIFPLLIPCEVHNTMNNWSNKPDPVEPFSVNQHIIHILVHPTPLKYHHMTHPNIQTLSGAQAISSAPIRKQVLCCSWTQCSDGFATAPPSEVVHTRSRTRPQCWCTWRGLTGTYEVTVWGMHNLFPDRNNLDMGTILWECQHLVIYNNIDSILRNINVYLCVYI